MSFLTPDNRNTSEDRLSSLRATGILDDQNDPAFDDITLLAAQLCEAPIAAVTFVDSDRQWFKSIYRANPSILDLPAFKAIPVDESICSHTVQQARFLEIPDLSVDPRTAANPMVTGEPRVRFYAGVPLVTEDGLALGALCVLDIVPRRLSDEQKKRLNLLARQICLQIELTRRITAQRISEARLAEAQRIARIGSWEYNTRSERVVWTEEHFRLFEYNPTGGEPPFEDVQRRIHPDDRPEMLRLFTRAVETGVPYEMDFRILLGDGSTRWIRSLGQPIFGENGVVERVVGTAMDITQQQQFMAERERLLVEARRQADHDPLTGLLNHRAFHRKLDEEVARAQRDGTTLAAVMLDLDNFKFFNDVYGHAVGDEVLRTIAARLRTICRSYDTLARFGGDEFALILPRIENVSRGEIEARLRSDLDGLGYRPDDKDETIPIVLSVGAALLPNPGTPPESNTRKALLYEADERLRWAKSGDVVIEEARQVRLEMLRRIHGFSMLDALVTAVDNKDRYTRRHSEDVMLYSLMIARTLGMDEKKQQSVAVAALLHDVGKIGVPDAILRKPGKLDDHEFEVVRQHPQMGVVIVQAVPGLEETLDAVQHHHERWDGQGYPFGLRGEEIPLIARLMAVADAFSAMTTDRPYRKGMPFEDAYEILRAGSGTQWDARCVEAFLVTGRTGCGRAEFTSTPKT